MAAAKVCKPSTAYAFMTQLLDTPSGAPPGPDPDCHVRLLDSHYNTVTKP
jgi:hypothetical protein